MRTGRPKPPLILTDDERERLQSLAHRARSQPALARRARVVLACAEGLNNKTVARKLRTSLGMVGKWRARFLQARLEGLEDEPRPGAPRRVSDAEVERVVIQTLESTPRGETHWSTRGLAKATGLSRMTISRIGRAFGLQPHRSDTFKLSPDPLLIEKVRDIVGLYMNPPDHALVLCVDEKTQIQALDRTQPLLPLRPGQVERRTHDYKRHGTTSLFAALELKTNKVIAQLKHQHRSVEFRRFLDVIEAQVPAELDVHIIVDNYGTHKLPSSGNGLLNVHAFMSTSLPPLRRARDLNATSAANFSGLSKKTAKQQRLRLLTNVNVPPRTERRRAAPHARAINGRSVALVAECSNGALPADLGAGDTRSRVGSSC